MELFTYARQILEGPDLQAKLAAPEGDLTDDRPHDAPPAPMAPGRSDHLRIRKRVKVPSAEGMADPAQRVRILHAFANHELQAIELFAWAILAFPDAPDSFRRGLVAILREEQRHFRLYEARLRAHDHAFGDFPISAYFWGKAAALDTPLRFVCVMGLTFESANLDHALDYVRRARALGDMETADAIQTIHDDEIGHVAFAWRWLEGFKPPAQSPWEAYETNLVYPLRPAKAKGPIFSFESRRRAGIDADFIERLDKAQD